ncbi:MAG TPA: 16S rRNA (uracil(1498)-N(3))-methyltransferase [Thiolinea sp.]|nr:16S rRNA (uracil(1498)-N(3))-methyltransferase [Thiolinea sp.]
MRIPRFYCPTELKLEQTLALPEEVFRHAIQVLRLQVGEALILFNGTGGEYSGQLVSVSKRSAAVELHSFESNSKESPLELTLAQALLKPDKMDFALQKAVELGISSFQPLITQRSVIRTDKDKIEKKLQHWQAVAIGACEQCGRTKIPLIHSPKTLNTYLTELVTGTEYLILAPESTQSFKQLSGLATQLTVLIGPEGGFTEEELTACIKAGMQGLRLGSRILRAETASTSVLAIIQLLHGDLGI